MNITSSTCHDNIILAKRNNKTLPDFAVLGTLKAGTTSVYHYFRQHPEIYLPTLKEPNFFSFDETDPHQRRRAKQRSIVSTLDEYSALFSDAKPSQRKGDISTTYFQSPLAVNRILQIAPDLKMIVCLRDPVDRAYSHWQMLARQGHDSAHLEPPIESNAFWVRCSLYADALSLYFQRFGRDQIKIVIFDDFARDSARVMRELFAFVEVDDGLEIDTSYRFNAGGVPRRQWLQRLYMSIKRLPGVTRFTPEALRRSASRIRDRNLERAAPLQPQVRERWLKYYRSDIERTQHLLGRDLSAWLEVR